MEVALSRGLVALVDDEDYERINQHNWYCDAKGYAVRSEYPEGKQQVVRMHRIIINAPPEMTVDHINGDRLDNRKQNLRLATKQQQLRNRPKFKSSRWQYKGVQQRETGRWRATINNEGKAYSLGSFGTEVEAAKAYDAKAKELFGEFARLNFSR